MIASPGKAGLWGACAAIVLTGGVAQAQTVTVPLTPPALAPVVENAPQDGAAPSSAPPPGPLQLIPQDLPETERAPEPEDTGNGIAVRSLQSIDPESIGVLDAATGGFPVDMWTGTPRERIDALMARLPTAPVSIAQREITRRLLLSRAAIPLRPAPAVASTAAAAPADTALDLSDIAADAADIAEEVAPETGASLLDIRLKALFDLGLLEDLDALVHAAPSRTADPNVQRLLLDTRLLRNDLPGACAMTAAPPSEDLYWLKASAFCKGVAGDTAGAEFGAALIEETGGPEDRVFLNLLQHLTAQGGPAIDTVGQADALEIAMLRTAKLPWPEDLTAGTNPRAQQILVSDTAQDPLRRILAAETLVRIGRLEPDGLLALYTDIGFDAETLASALSVAEETGGPLGRALLVQAALAQENTVARAELLSSAFDLARADGVTTVMGRVLTPLLSTITPQRELWWLADDAARAYFAAGSLTDAQGWTAILRSAGARNPEARAEALSLWPVARIAGDRTLDRLERDMLAAWRDRQREIAPDDAVRRTTLFYALLESLGEPVPESAWEDLLLVAQPAFQRVPNAALSRAIVRAADGFRQGETVLLALVMLGDAGPALATPATLGSVVQSLSAVGLPADARSIALDAVLGSGL